MREIKVESEQRQRRRTRLLRRAGGGVVIAGIVVLVIVLVSSGGSPKKAASNTTTTTVTSTSASTSTTVAGTPVTAPVSHTPVAPTCPPATSAGAPHRVIAFTKAPPTCISPTGTYNATIQTDVGTFVVQMKAADSEAAVNNFVFLARYHFYDGVVFHRVIPGFVVQGGDPAGTGSGGPGYSYTGNTPASSCQAKKDCYPLWSVAVANSGTTSSDGSQFFVVVGASGEQLPPSYTLFGQVISGTAVVQHIAADGNSTASDSGVPPKVLHHMIKVTITQVS